jgi:hypothetical protein
VWTFAPADRQLGGIVRYTGVDSASPIDVSAATTGNSTTPTAPAVTTTKANDLVLVFYGYSDWVTFSTPAGMTERYDIEREGLAPYTNSRSTAESEVAQAVAGSTGPKASTITRGVRNNGTSLWTAQTIALAEPGAATPPGRTFTIPTSGSILINNNNASTSSTAVTLTIDATGATQMVICNASNFVGCDWEAYDVSKSWELTPGLGTKTVYTLFKSSSGDLSSLVSDTIDLVAAGEGAPTPTQAPTSYEGLIMQDPMPAASLPVGVQVGTLVKIDGLSTVYFIDNDNRRHAFPSDNVYFSWFSDFSNVKTISAETLAAIPLGSNVTMRPGTWLVKIQSDLKTYAVEPYGIIRWVKTEEIASALYGSEWNKRIVDIDPAFFVNYQLGPDVSLAIHPNGSVIKYANDTKNYYIDSGLKKYITSDVFASNLFQNNFVCTGIAATIVYPDGANLTTLPIETLMSLR